jgi:hypothetical protein
MRMSKFRLNLGDRTRFKTTKAVVLAVCLAVPSIASALGIPAYVTEQPEKGSFVLVSEKQLANIYVDTNDHSGLQRAVGDLLQDIQRVSGQKPQIVHAQKALSKHVVLVGSIGNSELIDQLIASGKIDTTAIADRWEGYHIEHIANPFPGVERALVIAGSDKRGTIYGVYELSEQIGVSPWYWWADVPVEKKSQLYVKSETRRQDAPEVKYRGIFLNDEAPALTNWVHEKFGNYNHEFYVHVFELLLRLKGNYLWPAMWNNAFADDDPQNMILADEYGIVMGTSHHEPMMRADKEWNRYGEGAWEYSTNPENLYKFWVEGAKRNKDYESIYTLGMRGQADTPMSEGENIGLLERIVDDQREILANTFERDITEVPQVWALYKEVQSFYEKGMRVPEDVTLLWADDNWGNIRRLPTPEERGRAGGAGVYYHFDYVGGPRSYRWINVTPIAKIWEQMNLAYNYEANRIWITNVGDLKPMEFPTEFFLRMAWNPNEWPKERLVEYGRLWATREFGPEHAAAIEELITGYTRHNSRRKPELQSPETYSLLNYREADRISAELEAMVEQAEALYQKMPQAKRDAFYQLVLHPVKASATITQMYIAAGRNHLHAGQGRANSQELAQKTRALFQLDSKLEDFFHTELAGGKWNHMMSQPRIGYTHWNNPPANTMPVVHIYEPHDAAEMGVAVEGMEKAWPNETAGQLRLPGFNPYSNVQARRIDVFNRGTQPFTFNATANQDWIKLSKLEGSVTNLQTIDVSIDWDKAPTGNSEGIVHVTGTGWGGAKVTVAAFKPERKLERKVKGFVETNGYVSIEPAHFSNKHSAKGLSWEEIPQHGRTGSSMSTFPVSDVRFEDPSQAPYLEYDVFFFSTGEFEVINYFAPSLEITPGYGLRYAVAFDTEKPQIVDILTDFDHSDWQESVRNGVHKVTSKHTIREPGLHKLRIYRVDPAVTLQKTVIDTGGLKPSYLGPPESPKL